MAVVGSGLAGLTAAYRLAKTPKVDDVVFEVHVFEKVRGILLCDSSVVCTSAQTTLAPRCDPAESRPHLPVADRSRAAELGFQVSK